MRQPEVNKLVNSMIKVHGKKQNWKFSSGFLFIKKGLLFFVLTIVPNAKNRKISFSLNYKLFDFDEVFWNVVDLKENINKPLSFHASGVWTAPTMSIDDGTIEIHDWNDESVLNDKIIQIIERANYLSTQLAEKITDIDQNLENIESLYRNILEKYPNTSIDTFKEQIMTAILKQDYLTAQSISESRMLVKETGGFIAGQQSFYEMAVHYLKDFI